MRNSQSHLDELLATALQHHQAGHLPQAEKLYRQVLQQDPRHARALYGLGTLAVQTGHNPQALELLQRAAAGEPNWPEVHEMLGSCLYALGRRDEALAAYQQAVALNPEFVEALNNLGNVLREHHRYDEAIAACQKAIDLRPAFSPAYNNLGSALGAKGLLAQSIEAFRQAVTLDPMYATAYANLRQALAAVGRLDEAIPCYRRTLALSPNQPELWRSFGATLRDRGLYDEAMGACQQALHLRPHYAEAFNLLSTILRDANRKDEAIAACQQALALRPDYAEAHNNLGAFLWEMNQVSEALAAYRKAIALKPEFAAAHSNLATAQRETGRYEESRAEYQRALELDPDNAEVHSGLLFGMHYDPKNDPQMIAEAHRNWNRCHAQPLQHLIRPHGNNRDPNRRLKIGYVSPDFCSHAVAPMVLPLITHHDHERFEVFCYAQVPRPDAMTKRFQAQADHWRSIVGLSDEQVAEQVRQDRIDILVDLAGHTADGRLRVFARKPAPVQVARQGYPNTTGLDTIDYRMTDTYADPPGFSDTLHSEKIMRLPQTNWIYQPPPEEASVAPCPFPSDQPITFGCFNNFAKVSEPALHLWAQILKAVPASRLLLKAKSLVSADVRQRVLALFDSQGIGPERLELVGKTASILEHIRFYHRMAIALDPFPYHGTTTTCEALWMGVPVITLAGQTHVSRVGVSLLYNLGTPEFIAHSPEDYFRIAVALAHDRPRLAHLHATLRQQLQNSPLMDHVTFSRNMEGSYRDMWRTWCASPA